MSIVVPGEKIPLSTEQLNKKKLIVGPGVYVDTQNQNEILISNAGVLRHEEKKHKQLVAIESSSKTYNASEGDFIIGTIRGTLGENFKVSYGEFKASALLSFFAFENASKKNRPNLKNGSLVYCKVTQANPFVDVEVECYNSSSGKADGFGELVGGNLVQVDTAYARYLLYNENNAILSQLGQQCEFEIAIGVNGQIWVKSTDVKNTYLCCQYIRKAQHVDAEGRKQLVKEIFRVSS